jgi:glutamate--cysteine ligase
VWAGELIDSMRGLCELLDQGDDQRPYTAALEVQAAKLDDPGLTPSARTLRELESTGESFAQLALRMSRMHKSYFLDLYPPNEQRLAEFAAEAEESLRRQAEIEAADKMTFDQFLANYFRA